MKYTLLTGNPIDGFRSIGIFNSSEDAVAHGDMQKLFHDYSIMEIEEIQRTRPTKSEMIEMLIEDDIDDWNNKNDLKAYLYETLNNGFEGYNSWSDEKLKKEMIERDLA